MTCITRGEWRNGYFYLEWTARTRTWTQHHNNYDSCAEFWVFMQLHQGGNCTEYCARVFFKWTRHRKSQKIDSCKKGKFPTCKCIQRINTLKWIRRKLHRSHKKNFKEPIGSASSANRICRTEMIPRIHGSRIIDGAFALQCGRFHWTNVQRGGGRR